MTTNVMIVCPKPNHKRVRVSTVRTSTAGKGDIISTVDLNHGETTAVIYVYDGVEIVVTEID